MDLLSNLALGFGVALVPTNLLYAFGGCLLGTLIGVLPGIGPVAAIAMLLPATYTLSPVTSLILLAGVYYGAQYGRFTAAIFVTVPGESSSAITCIDGYQMAHQGRAGRAIVVAGLGSFFAGCVGTLTLAAFAPALAQLAFQFGPAEYFSLMVLGMVGAVVMASGSLIKAIGMVVLGLLLSLVGTDGYSGLERFAFDLPELANGISFVALAIGVLVYGAIINNLTQPEIARTIIATKIYALWPARKGIRKMTPAVLRGTALGSFFGVLPGGGALRASLVSYALEKRIKSTPGEVSLGQGNIRGVAAPESAYNAATQTSFIPMLTFGIPLSVGMVLMVGALTIHHIQPGPQVMTSNPELFWGLIASMCIGNLTLVALNLPLITVWVKLLSVPYRWLFPAMVLLCALGVYTTRNSTFDVWLVAAFGFIGYLFNKLDMEPAPLLVGFILGPMMEENLRQALSSSNGDWGIFVMRPLSAGLMLAAACALLLVLMPTFKSRRGHVFVNK